MRTFLTVLKTNYLRTIPRIVPMVIMTLVMLVSILLGVYMTRLEQVKGHVAFITQSSTSVSIQSTPQLDITVCKEKPPYSDLVKQKYDAFITVDATGQYQVETLHSDTFKQTVLNLLNHPEVKVTSSQTDRGIGANIIGFMMMFLLMIAFTNLFAFADDKEQGQLRRIAASPASFGCYLLAHCVYCLSFLLPAFLMLTILKGVGWTIGFTLLQYAGLMVILCFLGISVALLLHTIFQKPDNANMLGSALMVLTSIVSGSFYSFSKNNGVVDNIIGLLPQKELMNFAQHLQNGIPDQGMGSLLYVIAFSLVLFALSCGLLRQKFVKKV
jgi:ABC-2 type transport system permease protein